jgi:hypothetical protein
MPQLDPVTFLSQFFWLSLVFSVLYLLLVKYFLPSIARTLKVREYLQNESSNLNNLLNENSADSRETGNIWFLQKNFELYPELETTSKSSVQLEFKSNFEIQRKKDLNNLSYLDDFALLNKIDLSSETQDLDDFALLVNSVSDQDKAL